MESKVARPAHTEELHTTPRKKGGRIRNHCVRFWWCDCLVLIAIILVIILPIIFVAIPKKAQHEINSSTLEVTSQEVTNPNSDSVHLKLESVIKSGSSYHPTVDGFRAALSIEGSQGPFIYIDIPQAKSDAETHISVEQDVKFTSLDAFSGYTQAVLGAETFDVHLDGKTKVHLKGLPGMKVNYNKVVKMKGLNKLQGLNITSIKLLSGAKEILSDGSNMVGTVYVPNPSVMLLDLGNVTMNLFVDGTSIGYALLPDLVLKPGNNTVPMQAHVDSLLVVQAISKKYRNAIIPLDIVGNSSIRNGVGLTYYEQAIRKNTVRVDLNVGPALAAIGINLTSIAGAAS